MADQIQIPSLPSIPQGEMVVNAKQIDDLIKRINSANTCEDLQKAIDQAAASLGPLKAEVEKKVAQYQAWLELLNLPSINLTAIFNWIKSFVQNFLAEIIKPYLTYPAQLTILTTKIGELETAFNDAKGRIKDCKAKMPTI